MRERVPAAAAVGVFAMLALGAWPAGALAPAAFVAGLALAAPAAVDGDLVRLGGVGLGDPYLLTGLPLLLALWTLTARSWRLGRLALALVLLELAGAASLALTAQAVLRHETDSLTLDGPHELVTLAVIAATHSLPFVVWLLLEPGARAWLGHALANSRTKGGSRTAKPV